MKRKKLNRIFIKQHGQSDCGVACLASIVRYYGGVTTLDYIRQISGTTKYGTNLLGLKEAAQVLGFNAWGLEAINIKELRKLEGPVILHVLIQKNLQHYVVFYGFEGNNAIIGDPQSGVELWSLSKLEEAWYYKALLKLEVTNSFKKDAKTESNFKWLQSIIKEDQSILSASLFLGFAIAVFSVATAVFTQQLIDSILPQKKVTNLIIGLSLLFAILLIKSGLSYVRSLFLTTQAREFNKRIIKQFYNSILLLPQPFFDSKKTGELVSRMNDTSRIQTVISNLVGTVLIELFMTVISIFAIFFYNSEMGFITFGVVPLSLCILLYFTKAVTTNQRDVMGLQATNESNYIDTITGISEIKSLNKQALFSEKTAYIYEKFQDKILDFGKIKIRFGFLLELVTITVLIVSLGYSSSLVFQNEMKIGELVAVLSLVGSIIPSLTRSIIFYIQIQEAKVAVERMKEFTNLEPEKGVEVSFDFSNGYGIQISGLNFKYPGTPSLLKDITLSIKPRKLIVLIGESGSGKSTLLQIIHRFYKQQSGDIFFGSTNINSVNPYLVRNHLGLIQQNIKIFNNSLLFNIALSDDESLINDALKWCNENGFHDYFIKFPQGYATLLGEDGVNISGGQKQLVAFARTLFRRPKILLVDEGTSAMDRSTENFILSLLNKAKEEIGILLVTHRIKTASKGDFIYILENGKISASGAPLDLLETENFYSRGFREIIETTVA